MRLAAIALIVILSPAAVHASAHGAPPGRVRAAWAGHVRPGKWTEIRVDVVAARRGIVRLEAAGGDVRTAVTARVGAGDARVLHLPVLARDAAAVTLTTRVPGFTRTTASVPLEHPAASRALVVVSAPLLASFSDGSRAPSDPALVAITANDVPERARAWESVDAVVVDASLLAAMTTRQLRAFESHLAGCGPVLAVGLGMQALARGKAVAGCGGRYLRAAETPELARALAALLSDASRRVRSAARETDAAPSAWRGPDRTLCAMFALYLAAVLIVVAASNDLRLLVAFPALASALFVTGFGLAGADVLATPRAELAGGVTSPDGGTVLRVNGFARGKRVIRVAPGLDLPDVLHVDSPATFRFDETGAGADLVVRTSLLSRHAFAFPKAAVVSPELPAASPS
jgi:hypothetical protein